jgi:hypothetical protein
LCRRLVLLFLQFLVQVVHQVLGQVVQCVIHGCFAIAFVC